MVVTMTDYKTFTGVAGAYGHGDYSDYMPTQNADGTWTPGEWLPPVRPVLCKSGYHWCDGELQLLRHLGEACYVIEHKGETVRGDDKCASETIRLLFPVETYNETNLRLFAVDCARQVAHLTEDPELVHAILDVCVAYAEYGEEWATAWAAARAAAWDATGATARAAAGAAAWDATGDAAWAAARAAAWAAAGAAAWDAARDAAGDAAWDAQSDLLARYLSGEVGPLVERDGDD
jgi:hypothetical protein